MTDTLSVSPATAGKLLERLPLLGAVDETTGGQRNRVFRYTPYVSLFAEEGDLWPEDVPVQTTESEHDQ